MKRRNIQFYSFLIILSSFISCIDSIRYSGIKKELSLESVDTAYCQKDEELGYVSYIIRSEIGSSSWAEFHKPLLASNSQNDKDRSLRVLKARAILAKCAVLLFEAIPTGSARDISSIINLESALKDIDMSVSYKNLETAKDWLKDRVEEPDRAIELSLLLDPIDILSCRAESKDKVESCVQEDVLTTSKIILLNEKKMRERHLEGEHTASESSLKQLCSANFTLPEPKSPATEIFSVESGKEYKGFLQKNAIDPLSPKAVRFYAIFLALKDSAYYMQSGSIRTWVIDREGDIQKRLNEKFPEYSSNLKIRELQQEGAALEQYIRAFRYEKDFYYKYKYLFRAMEHIGFDPEKKVKELTDIHKLLKKARPASLSDAYKELIKNWDSEEFKKTTLKAMKKKPSLEEFMDLIRKQDGMMIEAIQLYYSKTRKNSPIWTEICKK